MQIAPETEMMHELTPEELTAALREVTRERIMEAARSAKLDTVYFLHGKEEA